jgi:hypothetical protein
MTFRLADQQLNVNPMDRQRFQWMLEQLIAGKPSFRFLNAQLNDLPVYVFTRHQNDAGQRSPSLFIMAHGWQKPIIISDEPSWRNCHQDLANQHKDPCPQA